MAGWRMPRRSTACWTSFPSSVSMTSSTRRKRNSDAPSRLGVQSRKTTEETAMITRFYGYINKVFQFHELASRLTDSRLKPAIPTAAMFGTAFAMFATCRGSLNGIDKERHFPGRLRNLVGSHVPSGDSVGRVYGQLDSRRLTRDAQGRPPSHQTQQNAPQHNGLDVRRRGRPRIFSPAANAAATSASPAP